MITLKIEGIEKKYPKGITYEEIAEEYQEKYDNQIALVSMNGKVRELFKHANKSGELSFFTMRDALGSKTYARTATMVMMKAIYDAEGAECALAARVNFTIGAGYYITITNHSITEEFVKKIKARMEALRELKMPLIKRCYKLEDAKELFLAKGMKDKSKLFRYRRSSTVNIYEMEGYFDYYYGYMLPNAGYLKYFDLIPYNEGMLLVLPKANKPTEIPKIPERNLLFSCVWRFVMTTI